ncbi:MAG: hypothetical protein AB7T49_19315 [Oligoflexales bacterium]
MHFQVFQSLKTHTMLLQIGLFTTMLAGSAAACPQASPEWKKQLENFAQELTPDLGNDVLYKSGPHLLPVDRYQKVIDFWDNCSKEAPADISILYHNIVKHSRYMSVALSSGHAGLTISDEEYLLDSYTTNRDYAELPKVFFQDNYLPPNWHETVENCASEPGQDLCRAIKSWRFISFASTLEDGSGHHERVIIQIPHKTFQQYLLFFPKHPVHKVSKLVDIIAVRTHAENGEPLTTNPLYFFERHNKGFAMDGGRCYGCHVSGLREVNPMHGTVIERAEADTNLAFNQEVRKYKNVDWRGTLDFEALGPPIGETCVQCHRIGGARGPLTILTKPSLIRSKVVELEMPYPGIYQQHFDLMRRIPSIEDFQLRHSLRQIASAKKADPENDYRSPEDVRAIREAVHKELLQQGQISYPLFISLRIVDNLAAKHIDYKLKHFFSNYKEKFQRWLQGS